MRRPFLLRERAPIPWEEFFDPVDLVIMDATEQVREIGLWIEVVHFCAFDDRHGARQGLGAGLGTSK